MLPQGLYQEEILNFLWHSSAASGKQKSFPECVGIQFPCKMVTQEFLQCLLTRRMSISPGKVDRIKVFTGHSMEIVASLPMQTVREEIHQ